MTDRFNAFVVVLDHDLRDDDAQDTLNAIRQIKGVLNVEPKVVGLEDQIAYGRARDELSHKLWKALHDG